MTDALLDADAFHCLRTLGLLDPIRGSERFAASMTEYIARHELIDLADEIEALVATGRLHLEALRATNQEFRRLRRAGMHRGEAEAVAWALSQPRTTRPVFVSNDRVARRRAEAEGVYAADVLDLVVELIDRGILTEDDARRALAPWDDQRQELCRPRDWSGFDESVRARRSTRPRW